MSDSFTNEDIHRIRVEDYEQLKSLTTKEPVDKINAEADAIWERFKRAKANRLSRAAIPNAC